MSKRSILIIEDEASLLELLNELLIIYDYVVSTITRGIDGVLLAKSLQPDCILLDLTLPDISGIEVIRRLKAESSTETIPVIVLTGVIDSLIQATVLHQGAYAFITKPFETIDLLNILSALLGESEEDDSETYPCD